MIRSESGRSGLVNDNANMNRPKNSDSAVIGNHDHTIAFGSYICVIYSRDRIVVTIRCPDDKWDERRTLESFTNVNNHRDQTLH